MDLFEQVSEDIKNAMKAKDKVALETLRNVKKFFLEAKTAPGANDTLMDADALKIMQKLVKQGKDSATIYVQQGRQDLADVELEQVKVIEKYLPQQMICIPMFIVAIGILLYSQKDKDGFDMIWRYFAWSNQTLAVFTLWALTVYLVQAKKLYVITLIPALFMTAVCSTYIFVAPEGFGLSSGFSQLLGLLVTLNVFGIFLVWKRKKV